MIKAHFTKIKAELIQRISASSSNIVIAVAWFTHRELFAAILSALDRGVSVSLLLIDDMINRNVYNLDFNVFIQKGGQLKFVSRRKTLMHNKFCVFDSNVVVTGSYNWTYAAETRNNENIVVTDDQETCNAFHTYFNNLWKNESPVTTFTQTRFSSYQDSDFLREFEAMEEEFEAMQNQDIINDLAMEELLTRRNNIAVIPSHRIITVNNRKDPVLKMNIGMDCIIDGVDGRVLNIIKAGQKLPFTNTVDTCTSADNQTSISGNIRFGNEDEADKNQLLIEVPLYDLPPLKAGEVSFKTKVTIDTNGYLHVERVCVNTGVAKEGYCIKPELIEYR